MLYYTQHVFCLTYFRGWGEGVPKNMEYIIDTKNKGNNIRSSHVLKLRHARVVVSIQYPRKKPVSGMHSSRCRIVWCYFFREDSLEKYRRCALVLPWSLTPLLWSFAGQVQAVVLVRN